LAEPIKWFWLLKCLLALFLFSKKRAKESPPEGLSLGSLTEERSVFPDVGMERLYHFVRCGDNQERAVRENELGIRPFQFDTPISSEPQGVRWETMAGRSMEPVTGTTRGF
jgi:hypothetical protein